MITKHQANKAVFTLKQIVHRDKEILYVVHEEDDEWQFLSGEAASLEDMMMVTLQQVLDIDSSIEQILDLKEGYKAKRSNSSSGWTISKSV